MWRPILEGFVSLGEVKRVEVDIVDLLKLNALMDMRAAAEQREADKVRNQ